MPDGVGRTRQRLAKMLTLLGYQIDPADLHCSAPALLRADVGCWRWWGCALSVAQQRHFDVWSYDTMASCVHDGIVVSEDEFGGYQVSARKTP